MFFFYLYIKHINFTIYYSHLRRKSREYALSCKTFLWLILFLIALTWEMIGFDDRHPGGGSVCAFKVKPISVLLYLASCRVIFPAIFIIISGHSSQAFSVGPTLGGSVGGLWSTCCGTVCMGMTGGCGWWMALVDFPLISFFFFPAQATWLPYGWMSFRCLCVRQPLPFF